MIRYMVALRALRHVRKFGPCKIEHVKGHDTSIGNIAADTLANQGAFIPRSEAEPDWDTLRDQVEREIEEAVRGRHENG
jgi:hypothetical protein